MSEVAAPVDGVTAGMLLRHAREAAGLHVDTLAANLKVPVRKLEALEEDRYDLLPDAVFARALASSVCRTLKVDAQPVLERLPQSVQPRLKPDGPVINAPFRSPSIDITRMTNSRFGKAYITSTKRIRSRSARPPSAPDRAPIGTPISTTITWAPSPTIIDTRAP